MVNPILNTDGYKLSHAKMYPSGSDTLFSYVESRGVDPSIFTSDFQANPEIVHFGSAIASEQLLESIVTRDHIEEADDILSTYGVEWNRAGWVDIVKRYEGVLPVDVYALPDGTVIPPKMPQAFVFNTDPNFLWLTSYLEVPLLRSIWYASTVATLSRSIKKTIAKYLLLTAGHTDGIEFKLHDFGARGVSSRESAEIGGLAHLVNFSGTDTLSSLVAAKRLFGVVGIAHSVPATEHSTITSWGRDREVDAYRNFLKVFGKPGAIISCVSDSYDIYEACDKLWGQTLKQEVIDSGAVLVIRPDSGDPVSVVRKVVATLANRFGVDLNAKQYKVLKNVRVLQGDGISAKSVEQILDALAKDGFSAENIVFGMGGGLLQSVNRDTLKYAMKASAIRVDGAWRDVYKDPITDAGKKSKRGLLTSFHNASGELAWLDQLADLEDATKHSAMTRIYSADENFMSERNVGTFDEVRARAAI